MTHLRSLALATSNVLFSPVRMPSSFFLLFLLQHLLLTMK